MNNIKPVYITKPNFKVWSKELIYKGTRPVDRKYTTPTHSFMVYFDAPYDKGNTVTLVQVNKHYPLPFWLAARTIELLMMGEDNGLTTEDALLYAADLAKMDGEVLVLVGAQ